jgi:hypothetical protein
VNSVTNGGDGGAGGRGEIWVIQYGKMPNNSSGSMTA